MSAKPSDSHFVLRLPRKSLQIVGIAIAAGFLLFLLAWWLDRDDGFYTVEPAAKSAETAEALPAPLPGDGDGASGMEEPAATAAPEEVPALVETVPMPTPVEEAPAPPPAPAESIAPPPAPAPATAVAGDVPTPIAGHSPQPEYPASAVRRGHTGTVVVRVQVDAGGVPTDVQIAQRSGTRSLDRAALEAVRDWRFVPAQRDGQPVAASVDIPITFDLQR